MELKDSLEEQEQLNLFKQYQEKRDPGIREKLILHNLKLVKWVTSKYHTTNHLEQEDLFQSGVIGLIRAIEDYNPIRGAFSTYAIYWIRQAISRDIMSYSEVIRIPEHIQQDISQLKQEQGKLSKILKRDPTVKELSISLNKDIKKINELLNLMRDTISLNAAIGGEDEDITLQDGIKDNSPTPDIVVEDIIFLEEFKELSKSRLTKLQYNSIIMFYGLTDRFYNLTEIANKYNYKVEYVRREKDNGLGILRRTRYFKELQSELDNQTSFYKSIDYSQPKVSGGGYKTSPVERIVAQREHIRDRLMREYGINN